MDTWRQRRNGYGTKGANSAEAELSGRRGASADPPAKVDASLKESRS